MVVINKELPTYIRLSNYKFASMAISLCISSTLFWENKIKSHKNSYMSDGIKGAITGCIIGMAFMVFIYINASKYKFQVKEEWAVPVVVTILGGLYGIVTKHNERKKNKEEEEKKEEIRRIYIEIGKKADDSSIEKIQMQLHEHKEMDRMNGEKFQMQMQEHKEQLREHKELDKINSERVFEYMATIDHKLDILIADK